jgi:hypothetical protein
MFRHVQDAVGSIASQSGEVTDSVGVEPTKEFDGLIDVELRSVITRFTQEVVPAFRHQC